MKDKSFIKRTVSGIMALALLTSAVSCSNKSNGEDTDSNGGNSSNTNSGSNKPVQTADQVISNSYRSIEIETGLDFEYVSSMETLSNGKILISGSDDGNESGIYLTDSEFLDFQKLDTGVQKPENGIMYVNAVSTASGNIIALANVSDYGDVQPPDYDDPDFDYENYDYEALEKATTQSYYICIVDGDGNIVSSNQITGLEEYKQTYEDEDGNEVTHNAGIGRITAIGDDKFLTEIYSDEEHYVVINAEGKIETEVELGDDLWMNYSMTDKDGNIAFTTYEDGQQAIKFIDGQTLKLSDKTISMKDSDMDYIRTMINGNGDYIFYLSGGNGLYGLKEDGTCEELVNYIDSDLNGDYVQSISTSDDGDFVIYYRNYESNERGFFRLTKRDVSELSDTVVITMGMLYTDSRITSKVTEFNKSNDKYRIKISDYSKYDEWDEEAGEMINSSSKQLKLDIVSGNAPDMIWVYNNSIITSLASKGIYADLYDFLGTNGSVSKEDIMPNVLEACEIDGKLLSLSPTFTVSTFAAKTKFADIESWNFDEFMDTYNSLPEDMKLYNYENTKNTVFSTFVYNNNEFVDYENATCNFDSPDFIKILEFCNQFPSEEETINWETASDEEINNYWNERDVMFRNDKALLNNLYFYDMRSYAQAKQVYFGDDITLVGYVSNDRKGGVINLNSSFAIMDDSANKEACWEFISQFFTESYQTSERIYELPVLTSAFEKKLDSAMEKPYWMDENGKKHEYDETIYILDEEFKIDPITQEERDYLENYIKNSTTAYNYNEDVTSIIDEEVQSYFAGERSAEETASIIQNRASILISEQS